MVIISDTDKTTVHNNKKTVTMSKRVDLGKILKYDIRNRYEEVEVLQALLGFEGKDVDGIFGSKTEKALCEETNKKETSLKQYFILSL